MHSPSKSNTKSTYSNASYSNDANKNNLHRVSEINVEQGTPSVPRSRSESNSELSKKSAVSDSPEHEISANKTLLQTFTGLDLFAAFYDRDKEAIHQIIAHDVDLDAKNRSGETIHDLFYEMQDKDGINVWWSTFHWALKTGNEEALGFLCQKVKIDRILKEKWIMKLKNPYGKTIVDLFNEDTSGNLSKRALDASIVNKNEGLMNFLSDLNLNWYAVDGKHNNALHYAISRKYPNAVIKKIIDKATSIHGLEQHDNKEHWTPLTLACAKGNLAIIDYLLEKGAQVDMPGYRGMTSLQIVAKMGNHDLVKYLLSKRAHLLLETPEGKTAIDIVRENGHREILAFLLKELAEKKLLTSKGQTALHLAVNYECLEAIDFMASLDKIHFGDYINERDENRNTALHEAVLKGNLAIVNKILAMRPSIDMEGDRMFAPLHIATELGHKEIARSLLRAGANFNLKVPDGRNILHFAVLCSDDPRWITELVRSLGLDVNLKTNDGITPLHCAASEGYINLIEELIRLGANVNEVDNEGRTPLRLGVEFNQIKVIKTFGRCSADFEIAGNDRITPLQHAICQCNIEAIHELLFWGANVNSCGVWGYTPLHIAIEGNNIGVVKKLIMSHGIDLNALDEEGYTPLHLASYYQYLDVVELLVENGANVNAAGGNQTGEYTPIHLASDKGKLESVKKLIELGADLNIRTQNAGYTPLHIAAGRGHKEIVDALILAGANITLRDNEGLTVSALVRRFIASNTITRGHPDYFKYKSILYFLKHSFRMRGS